MENAMNNFVKAPLVCTRGVIVFPNQEIIIDVGREKSIRAVENGRQQENRQVVLVSQKDLTLEDPKMEDLYTVGTLCEVRHIRRLDGYLRVKFRGLQRCELHSIMEEDECQSAEVQILKDIRQDEMEEVTLVRMIARQFEDMEAVSAHMPKEMITELARGVSAQQLSDQIAQMFPFSLEKRQEFLETLGINDRLTLVLQEIQNEKQLSEIENKINEKVKERIEEGQKEYYLREKMRAIKEELGDIVDTEKDVVKGSIKQYQLDIIAKEIKSSLMTDVIVRELYKYEVIEEMAKFLDKDQRTAVHYIFNKIPKKKYYEICCKYLKENLSESNRKTEIEKGLRAWLAFLLWHGYSSEYIYRFLRNIFEESINDPEKKAQIFLNRFDFEIGKYKVYFVFYEKLKPYQKLLNERLHISFEDDGCFKQIKRKQKSFIGVMETKAYDNYSAMKRAYSALEIFLRYLEVFLNDNISVIGKNGLVIRQDTQEGIILPVKAFGYKSIKPEPRENFKTEIDTIVLGCQEKGKETYSQLNKIVDLHNAALNQQDLNDAFLNLWSALEVASVTDSSKSKIESVTDNIVSILQNDYFECIFSNILDDLKNNLGNRKVSLLLKDITEFDKEICKIAGFIFLEKYEKYREDYFANELKYYPNIRYKIYNLYEQRENREKLWHLSEKYCQRIEWHLYRLYRLRNAIVHAGESHKRIQMLGEHLHIYVDRVILELMVKLAKDKCLGTIQDVFTDTYLLLNKKKKNLKEPGNVDEQSIMLLLENFFIEE